MNLAFTIFTTGEITSELSFIQNYFFKLGFWDGSEGYICAQIMAWYSFLKYARLKELQEQQKNK